MFSPVTRRQPRLYALCVSREWVMRHTAHTGRAARLAGRRRVQRHSFGWHAFWFPFRLVVLLLQVVLVLLGLLIQLSEAMSFRQR